ncbi:MAG: hypothetical protein ACRC6M_00320, partial [Microcystaceae cyanobacterium]
DYLLKNPSVSGVMITRNQRVIGSMTRRALFERLSKEFSYALYVAKPIGVLFTNLQEDILKVPSTTSITDAVKLSFCRPLKSAYDPIVVFKNDQEEGLLDFSKLILAQSEMFSVLNEQLTKQDQELRNYAEQTEEQGKSVRLYAAELETQQYELQKRNGLLETQKTQLEEQTEALSRQTVELSRKSEEISNLNHRFEEVGILLSKEGKKTFTELGKGVEAVINFTDKINSISSDFQEKLTSIDQGNDLINKVSKRVENLSFQASIMGASLPVNDHNKIPFSMIIEEIEKLSVQILAANTSINHLSKEIRSQIRVLVKTATENQEVVTNLSKNSQQTEIALSSLSQLLHQE